MEYTDSNLNTRQLRRKALSALIKQLKSIMDAETTFMNNIPENLTSSQSYETAENAISVFEEALDILDGAY